MATWTRRPQERNGDYFFDSRGYVTPGIREELCDKEILSIVADLQRFVRQNAGTDYLQVYVSDDGRRIFCIDQLSRSMKESGDYTEEQVAAYDYWTMMFDYEY